jgi:1-deoxy-D-xylulose-5-phosphate reductoisomerase
VLGATGSVGAATLDLLARAEADVRYVALTAAARSLSWRTPLSGFGPRSPSLRTRKLRRAEVAPRGLRDRGRGGNEAVTEAARRPADWVMSAIVGAAGLAHAGCGGNGRDRGAREQREHRLRRSGADGDARQAGGRVIPVDSEHSAIFQVLDPGSSTALRG